jgi:hypothetical protein
MSTKKQTNKAVENKVNNVKTQQKLAGNLNEVQLKEGVTGAMLVKAKQKANAEIKKGRADYSQALSDIFTMGNEFIKQYDIRSKNHLKKLMNKEDIRNRFTDIQVEWAAKSVLNRGYVKHTPYTLMNAIEKVRKDEPINEMAKMFFDAYSEYEKEQSRENFDAMSNAIQNVLDARELYKAEKEAEREAELEY